MTPQLDPYLHWRAVRTGRVPQTLASGGTAAIAPDRAADTSDADDAPRLFEVLIERKQAHRPLILQVTGFSAAMRPLLALNETEFAPAHTHAFEAPDGRRPRFQPGLVTRRGLHLLTLLFARWADHECNNIKRWELSHIGRPRRFDPTGERSDPPANEGEATPAGAQSSGPAPAAAAPTQANLSWLKVAAKLNQPPKAGPTRPSQPAKPVVLPRQGVFVCVIDDGCNAAAAALQRGDRPVVGHMLVQAQPSREPRAETGTHRAPPLHDEPARGGRLRGALQGSRLRFGSGITSELGACRAAGMEHPVLRASHGAAVLDLIASPRLWIDDKPWSRCAPDDVFFVQLPSPTVVDTSGSSLASKVLVAVHDALDRAGPQQDVLVNLSFGTHSGPHDGSSMIESALLELLNMFDGSARANGKRLILVVPAGNSHLLRCHSHGQATKAKPSVIDWKVLPDDDTDNFLEIWVPPDRRLDLKLTPPGGVSLVMPCDPATRLPVVMGFDNQGMLDDYDPVGMLSYTARPPQSERSAMILIALEGNSWLNQPTESGQRPSANRQTQRNDTLSDGPRLADGPALEKRELERSEPAAIAAADPHRRRAFAQHGVWHIEIKPVDRDEAMPWHAWVQRGDVAPLRRRSARGVMGRQSYILDTSDNCPDADHSRPEPMFTLNGIATARHDRLFVVGALERADGRLSPYSSAGPSRGLGDACAGQPHPHGHDRTCGPDWVVAADESRRRRGLLVQGLLSGSHQRMSGTSMAAATLTRHLWEHLNACKDLAAFCGPPPHEDPAPTKIPAEAPEYAPEFCRGEMHRIVPTRPDGALDDYQPCARRPGPAAAQDCGTKTK